MVHEFPARLCSHASVRRFICVRSWRWWLLLSPNRSPLCNISSLSSCSGADQALPLSLKCCQAGYLFHYLLSLSISSPCFSGSVSRGRREAKQRKLTLQVWVYNSGCIVVGGGPYWSVSESCYFLQLQTHKGRHTNQNITIASMWTCRQDTVMTFECKMNFKEWLISINTNGS